MKMLENIPNNVELESDRKLQKALLQWLPNYLDWWSDMGPSDFAADEVYLRTAVSVHAGGWANYDYVKMPEYRWGIFLAPETANRNIGFGDHAGEPLWNEVPGEYRADLRRMIVTQADTEPASVEQQRLLGHSAPSLYDLRNLFQVNVEEGRHLWAMVYLLHKFFGRDGREEAEDLLHRRSGNADSPRILQAFNKPIGDWLSFFCFAMFTDRDGKFQLGALAESAFEALSRTTRFMLTEEAHHLFVGEDGLSRIIGRTGELMRQDANSDVTQLGGIPLDIIQKYINEWFSASVDLFGGEDSSNAANFFGRSLKGRWHESKDTKITDHTALDDVYFLPVNQGGTIREKEVPMRRAMNAVLLESYRADCERAAERWTAGLQAQGLDIAISIPSTRFNRQQGIYSEHHYDLDGVPIDKRTWQHHRHEWLPTKADREYIMSVMKPCLAPGRVAQWIAPPKKGIGKLDRDYEYVRFEGDPYVRA